MKALIRTDASLAIGSGHVMRCLTLADALQDLNFEVIFACRTLEGNLISLIKSRGYQVSILGAPKDSRTVTNNHCTHGNLLEVPYSDEIHECERLLSEMTSVTDTPLDAIIIDHYAIDKEWHLVARKYCKNIVQIDDIADRKHSSNILLDQNFYPNLTERYSGLLDLPCVELLGPKYALLENKFIAARRNIKSYQNRYNAKKVIMFFGGMDACNQTEVALKGAIKVLNSSYSIDVVVGQHNPNIDALSVICDKNENIKFHIQISNIEDLLKDAFLFIGAVGATTWERCICMLPGLVCSVADNQVESAKALDAIGSHTYLGNFQGLTEESYSNEIIKLLSDYQSLFDQSKISGSLVDGCGAKRVSQILQGK